MDRIDHESDVTDLGAASVETRGSGDKAVEIGGRLPNTTGIADDD